MQQFSIDLPNLKNTLLKTNQSFILGQQKISQKTYILIYGLSTLSKPKSGQVSTNKGIMTQNIANVSVLTSVELKKKYKQVIIL